MVNHPNRKTGARRKTATTTKAPPKPRTVRPAHDHDHDADYARLLTAVGDAFARTATGQAHVFETDAAGLYDAYLDALPNSERAVHTCHACRRFIESFGHLVAVDAAGVRRSVMWDSSAVPEFYMPVVAAMMDRVIHAKITGVFLSDLATWGTPQTGTWTHFSVTPPATIRYRERALTAFQAMAAMKERYRTVATALGEFTPKMLDEAIRVLEADAVNRAEKFIGPAKWLRALHDRPKGRNGEALMWKMIAAAPEGYCHPRASVIGPLLEDIASGMPFEDIRRRFNAKMHPLQYQRPQAAPTAGNIKAAEALVEKLGLANSLKRRFARMEDMQSFIWRPKAKADEPKGGGVFGHLKAKNTEEVQSVNLPSQTMTWDKFVRTVLPDVEAVDLLAPTHGQYIALTAATDPEAETIFKWPNGVAWYVYHNGASAQQFSVRGGTYVKVNAIVPLPTLWGDRPAPFIADGAVLILDGSVDKDNRALSLFPECIRDDLHGIRAVIEAHSKTGKLDGQEEASACGYDFRKGHTSGDLRVLKSGAWSRYKIDRWD